MILPTPDTADVAVVILNYNGRHHLQTYLPSVVAHSGSATVIVADNASTDDSMAWLSAHYPQVQVLPLAANHGFAKGYNVALAQVDKSFAVLLNSDVEVTPGWLQAMLDTVQHYPNWAAAQPKLLDWNRKTHFEYAGAAGGFIDKYGYPFCRGRIFDTLEQDQGQYDNDCPIFWASGAAMLVKLDVYKQLGGLDDFFFAHMEEIDLCWRLQNAGYDVVYSHKANVYHLGGGTLSKSNPRKTFLNFRNNLLMLYKNLPAARARKVIFMRLVLDGIAGIRLFTQGSFKEVWAIIRAHFAFYAAVTGYKPPVAVRNLPGIYPGSIVWQYFKKGIKLFSGLGRF